jgi:hypothetical protein
MAVGNNPKSLLPAPLAAMMSGTLPLEGGMLLGGSQLLLFFSLPVKKQRQ